MENLIPVFDLSICIRLISSVLLGFAIGLEREMANKYAGLRTNILVCVGACVFTILSIYAFPMVSVTGDEYGTRDTARVAAQIVTGIGFIGGGTVLRHGATVFGLTTAATLWAVASIGMACGAGMFGVAILTTILCIIVLVAIGFWERHILSSGIKNMTRIRISLNCINEKADEIYDFLLKNYPKLKEISKRNNEENEQLTKIHVVADINSANPIVETNDVFKGIEGIKTISIREYNEILGK
ncbi:MAG: MgtC/SapB family protein [Candidatus Gastranaerophilaceae bacterium]|nr:MgtC/SapB family protein [Candidatus Gastranaerophilaceae bacterium]